MGEGRPEKNGFGIKETIFFLIIICVELDSKNRERKIDWFDLIGFFK